MIDEMRSRELVPEPDPEQEFEGADLAIHKISATADR